MRAKEFDYIGKRLFMCFTIFPYQIAFGFSLGIFEGLRIRIYFLCFKIAINIKFMHK